MISIHALHEESDKALEAVATQMDVFQSTLSMRRATCVGVDPYGHGEFQSTLSMRRATDNLAEDENADIISIHALHEESDRDNIIRWPESEQFQSTLSMRRATVQLDIFVRFLRRKPAA